ncbi:MAG: hypothetical protein KGZ97_11690 [Bacteroidetes bacterium]|nr:hypothetical protein [Bacteroidota bacterium]
MENICNKNRINILLLVITFLFIFLLPSFVLAASPIIFQQQIDLPGFESGEIGESSIAKYIIAFYKWAIIAIAILAVLVIVNAGFGMITAGGNATKVVEKRNDLFNAIIGLILILAAIPMLNMINPALVRLDKLLITSIGREEIKEEKNLPPVRDPNLVCADKAAHNCGEVYRQVIEGRENICCGTRCSSGYICASVTGGDPLGGQICPPGSHVYRVCQADVSNSPQCKDKTCSVERICDKTCCFGKKIIPCYCPEGKICPCPECDAFKICQGIMCE